jgi:uncharacterized protein YdhG (YjbR/CyaY superfamily)
MLGEMRSNVPTVDAYLADVPADRRAKLSVIRALCREHLPDHEEAMQFGMPVYLRSGQAEFAWASQARYISLYVMKEGVVSANADRLAGLDMGKGCLRLKPSAEIDTELVRDLLIATAGSSEQPC